MGEQPVHPGQPSTGTRRAPQIVRAADHAEGRTPNRSSALCSLFLCTAGLVLTAPAVLKATEHNFSIADFCPEPQKSRLPAGSLTPRAGRQRATAASTVSVASAASESGRCGGGGG